MNMDKLFDIEYTPEAFEELKKLDKQNLKRALRTIELFSMLGREGVTSRPLDKEGLFEMKCDKVRIYFTYKYNKLIIIGLITLKKTSKAPSQYKLLAHNRIDNYLNIRSKDNEADN